MAATYEIWFLELQGNKRLRAINEGRPIVEKVWLVFNGRPRTVTQYEVHFGTPH